jgi:uroporphyrinogen III methyltransferase/synthase
VESVIAYSVVQAEPDPQVLQALIEGRIDVVALFSPSAVHGLLGMLVPVVGQPKALEILNRATTACVGPTTARAAQQAGLQVRLVATEHTIQGLIESLVEWRLR